MPVKKPQLFASLAALATTGLLLSACASSAPESSAAADCTPVAEVETVKDGALTVAVADYPPYIYSEGDGLAGADGLLLTRTAEALCLDLDVQKTSFTAIIEGIKSGRADITAGDWTLNDEREATFETSAPVYVDLLGVMSAGGETRLEELDGKKIGVVSGFLYVNEVQQYFGADNVTVYQSDSEAYQDLTAGRIDAHISAQGSLAYMLQQAGDTSIEALALVPDAAIPATQTPAYAVALITKGNTQLRDAVDTVIAELRDSGELAAALEENGVDPSAADVAVAAE